MRVVAFAPHQDDVVFSIAAHLATLDAEVFIVTPFAGIPTDPAGLAKHTTLWREHNAACETLGFKAVNGRFLDDVYPAPKRSEVSEWLAGWLDDAQAIFLPFGTWHPDHVLTSNLLIDLIRLLPGLPDKIYFYEELPYRLEYSERVHSRFAHIENNVGRLRLLEETHPNESKERAIRMYESQTDEELIQKLLSRERIWELIR